jgi:hypothetical protein
LFRLTGSSLNPEAVRKAADLDIRTLDAVGQAHLDQLHELAPTARYLVDKMPGNALHLGFVSTILPGARVIHCTRDPRDIGLSIFQHRLFGYHPYAHDLADLGWYIAQHLRLMQHWRATLRLPLLSVGLHNWVNDFQGTLRSVLTFLDLPYEPACEDFHLLTRKVRTVSKDQVREPINARGLDRWREYAHQLAPLIDELVGAGVLESDAREK